jgi:hypothetical protein
VEKRYGMDGACLIARYRADGLAGRLEIRLNVAMPSCEGYAGRYILEDGHVPCGFGQVLKLSCAGRLVLDDGVLGGSLLVSCDPPLAISARPHYTVSQSEAGFEKVMQAAELTLFWPLAPEGSELVVTLECRRRGA